MFVSSVVRNCMSSAKKQNVDEREVGELVNDGCSEREEW